MFILHVQPMSAGVERRRAREAAEDTAVVEYVTPPREHSCTLSHTSARSHRSGGQRLLPFS